MVYDKRVELYRKIEAIRGRPLIVYVTSHRLSAHAAMSSDVIPEFTKQILKIPDDINQIDILIVSLGGDPTVSWHLISMLRERFEKVGVLLPYVAYSAATLFALGADEIIMHPFSNLGPVDPQLTYLIKNSGNQGKKPERGNFSSEDLKHFLEFVRSDVGISDQEQMAKTFELLCNEVGPIPIGIAKRSTYLSLSMGEKLLSLHMKDPNKTKAIAEALNASYYHHGYPVGRKEAKIIGLPVIENITKELENLIWDVWVDIESELMCNKPFNELELIFENEEISKLIAPVSQIQIPPNLPQALLQSILQQILKNISIIPINPIDFEVTNAIVESKNCKSEYKTIGKINAVRMPDMAISTSKLITSQMWNFCDNDKKE